MLILDRVLTQKVVVSTVPKKELMIVLPYLGKFSLQIRTRIYRVMKDKLPHSNFRIVFQSKCKLINFFTFKVKFLFSYVLALLINLSTVALMLRVMAKLSAIIKFSALTGNRVKGDNDYAIKKHHFFPFIHLVLTIFPY